jgi:competence protein ComEC
LGARALASPISLHFARLVETQRPHLPLWAPVAFGAGVAVYFALPGEPGLWTLGTVGGLALVAFGTWLRCGPLLGVLLAGLILGALGYCAAGLRAREVAAPVLAREMTVAVEGRIAGLSRSATNRTRVTLDEVTLHGVDPVATPAFVRISLDESTPLDALVPGARLIGQARLSPPAAPSAPGGFDFRRLAWFDRLGAVGYAQSPMVEIEGGNPSALGLLAFRWRMALSRHIQAQVPGQDGAFSAAILTGDRSGIDPAVELDLRISTLYHLVSISGLHMTLIAAAVFVFVRYGLAAVPGLALRLPLKKIAAAIALAAGFGYLWISGFEVAAQRAYIMTACFLVAVLIDRPALTLRSVALAAMIVLAFAPESLMEAGFQMSFAATIGLISAFEALRRQGWWMALQTDPRWRFVKPVIACAMTSLVAGTATAPFSAFHFNLMAQYGLLANLLAVPMMGAVVMPAAVIGLALAPFGLDWLAFTVMGWGVAYVLAVAKFVANLGGAAVGVPSGPGWSLALIAFGGLVLALWIGRGRWAGLAPIGLGLALWIGSDRPALLVAPEGRLFGFLTPEGRALSSAGGDGYAASSWLEDDGDTAGQEAAAARAFFRGKRGRIEAEVPGFGIVRYVGFRDPASGPKDCAEADVLIAPHWREAPPGDCVFIGAERLARDGALALTPGPDGPVILGARDEARARPWGRDPAPVVATHRPRTGEAAAPAIAGQPGAAGFAPAAGGSGE